MPYSAQTPETPALQGCCPCTVGNTPVNPVMVLCSACIVNPYTEQLGNNSFCGWIFYEITNALSLQFVHILFKCILHNEIDCKEPAGLKGNDRHKRYLW